MQLHEALVAQGRAALSGLGGVGKTQTAVEYAHRHLDEYAYVLWVTADSHEALVSCYATLAGLLKLPEAGAQDQTAAVEAVKRWLASNKGWLLILDDADDIQMARAFLPLGSKGHVILTTRAQAVGVMNYWVYFNSKPQVEYADLVIFDDAHLAEQALGGLSTVSIRREGSRDLYERVCQMLLNWKWKTMAKDL